jgi:CheY-like chemotaxis protein
MERPRLLVVDDDPYTRLGLQRLFAPQGWQVSLAATMAEGLARLDQAPHCIILDLNLPDGGGEAILSAARARLPRTGVAVCSGLDDPDRLARVRRLNPELLLWKPVDLAPVVRLCQAAASA